MSKNKDYVTFREHVIYSSDNIRIKNEPQTPNDEDFGDYNYLDQSVNNYYGTMKKSLSMTDIAKLQNEIAGFHFNETSNMNKRYSKTCNGTLSKSKFVSMAEAIYHYQTDTPDRFHSSKSQLFKAKPSFSRPGRTIPQSPMLRSKTRARPTHIMSQKEREEIEIEEMKNFKIKAQPVPKAVISGPIHLPEVHKKPSTIPEPFNLTELPKKCIQSPEQSLKFKARPVPKKILHKPSIPTKPQSLHVTKPISPKFYYKNSDSINKLKSDKLHINLDSSIQKNNKKKLENSPRHGPIRSEPFSFEQRNEEIKRRKEDWIKHQIEEEKKQACQFKAQPLPKAVKKRMNHVIQKASGSSGTSSENKENTVKFEAKPPVVLYKQPFKPVLQCNPPVRPVPFDLTTEKRAAQREKFDLLVKEKEEEKESIRLQKEKEKQEMEERQKLEMRAKLIHHAKPMPPFDTFIPKKSVIPLTMPETPKFMRRLNQH